MRSGFGMFVVAALIVGAHGLAELAGLRDWVSVLSGTPVPGVPYEEAAIGGAVYLVTYFGAVLVAPILGIAGVLCAAVERTFDRRAASVQS